ncbi:hypothetical protein PFISCL1PPCAC_687 [Pristionchus fissidentatus]|uniref:C3H1-type domain-containing protein n=1 Tax=Pristionchus fissidentatus TaxID=1538716 RepID=A0AAV5UV46_9BILA|nr:hypothetical protein PFISCL1PPCAC_687 [Pristionchus fissidentatus]
MNNTHSRHYKTAMCAFWPNCQFATSECKFAHGEEDRRLPGLATGSGLTECRPNGQVPNPQSRSRKTRMCDYWPNCRFAAPECKFAHGEEDIRRPGHMNISDVSKSNKQQDSKYKTRLCRYQQRKGGCFNGGKCLYAHSELEQRVHLRLVNAIKNLEYKTKLCRNGVCTYKEKCIYIHQGDPEYAEYKSRIDALWGPVTGDITRAMAYETYADAVRSCAAVTQGKPTGPLPTHLPDGMTTEVIDIAVSNGCSKSHWRELCEIISMGYDEINRLDAQISRWNSNPCRERFSRKIADAKAERIEIENKLKNTVIKKNKYLNKDLLELHGFRRAEDAVELARLRIGEIISNPTILPKNSLRPRTLTLITGAGNRSAGNPKILEAVLNFLETHFEPEMLNKGCIIVPFKRSWLE